MTSPGYS